MANSQEPDYGKRTRSPNRRRTIGFLNASGLQFFHVAWRGIAEVTREHNVNAVSFVGQYVRDTKGRTGRAGSMRFSFRVLVNGIGKE
jgi:hypothetical protein